MKKKVLFLSIVCLLFLTLNYTYSAFRSNVVGNITLTVKDWSFNVNVPNGVQYNGGYKIHLNGTSGSFTVNINTTNGTKDADYTIELTGNSTIKFYKDSSYSNLISNNIYSGSIDSNSSNTITIYYKSDSNIDNDVLINTKAQIQEITYMKNGNSAKTEFWNTTYSPYIKTVEISNNISNLPSSCTDDNKCWDISLDTTQKKKVYAYLIDNGEKDSKDTTQALYNLIYSE